MIGVEHNLKIAIVSKADSIGGGASRVAEDLSRDLWSRGLECTHLVGYTEKGFTARRKSLFGRKSGTIRRLQKRARKLGFVEYFPFEIIGIEAERYLDKFDIFHFHDISETISPATIGYIARRRPVAWTFHDCSPFTGGCIYPGECERYLQHCGRCPKLGTWPLNTKVDQTTRLLAQKRRLHRSGKVHHLTPSHWMANLAFSTGFLTTRPAVIPNGVDINVFKPHSKADARRRFNLPEKALIILFSAGWLADGRKGARHAAAFLRNIQHLRPHLLLVGRFSLEAALIFEGLEKTFIGLLDDADELAEIYSAADAFITFSSEDNLPLVVLETMACAVPTIAFDTGGIPEMMEHEKTGLIVSYGQVERAAKSFDLAVGGDRLRHWGIAAREKINLEFSNEHFVTKHIDLYNSMLVRN